MWEVTQSKVEVAMVDESGIFGGLSIEFRGFRNFGFFLNRHRGSAVSLVLLQKLSELFDLLTQFSIRRTCHDAVDCRTMGYSMDSLMD